MPVTATYYAAIDSSNLGISIPTHDITGNYADTKKIEENVPILNYAAFFGKGIPLKDETLIFAENNTYLGFVGNAPYLTIYLSNYMYVKNGITIIFDRCACKTIKVYNGDTQELIVESTLNEPQLTRYIPFETESTVSQLYVQFEDVPEGDIMTLKGVTLGRIIDISDFFEFNRLAEICPLGDDLPLNETSSTVYLEDNFYDEEGQKIVYYDNSNVLEETYLIESEFEEEKHFMIKSQDLISKFFASTQDFALNAFRAYSEHTDWGGFYFTAEEVLKATVPQGINLKYPDFFKELKISPFLEPSSGRKILQQIAWACCCGIKTDKALNNIEFIPFLNGGVVTPNVVISNEDNRILKTKVKKGEKYGKINWEYSKYSRSEEPTNIGEITPELLSGSGVEEEFLWNVDFSKPTQVSEIEAFFDGYDTIYFSPYCAGGKIYDLKQSKVVVSAYEYTEQKQKIEIDLETANTKTLTISNQVLFPLDTAPKVNQLKKWYSKNNTLSATIVDNGDLDLGYVLKIELDNGRYFTGIITKIERNNVSDYHVLNVEAHEWD